MSVHMFTFYIRYWHSYIYTVIYWIAYCSHSDYTSAPYLLCNMQVLTWFFWTLVFAAGIQHLSIVWLCIVWSRYLWTLVLLKHNCYLQFSFLKTLYGTGNQRFLHGFKGPYNQFTQLMSGNKHCSEVLRCHICLLKSKWSCGLNQHSCQFKLCLTWK